MNEDFNDKFYDTAANAAESYEHCVRRLKIRYLIERNVIFMAGAAAVVYIVKKVTEDFESIEKF